MHFVVFGLSISSSWGNGHATLWRGMVRAMAELGHTVSFFEKNVPYYAGNRDGWSCPAGVSLRLYESLDEIRSTAMQDFASADVALWTSYCPEGARVSQMILDSHAAIKVFYDLDTPVTLSALRSGASVDYLPPEGLANFDLVLSYTGGRALEELELLLGAGRVFPLYGSFDAETHRPVAATDEFRSALCYLGTFAADRQRALEELLLMPASRMPQQRFVIGGAQYPEKFPWTSNIFFMRHLPPMLHPAFYCSARATLNVTRSSMAEYGYCPSGRLFEAAACGAVILSDWWEGLDMFFAPGEEILRVASADDVVDVLGLSDRELRHIGDAARQRALEDHTAARRIAELESICESLISGRRQPALRDVSEIA
jgi:spore maturation protein CgeB